MSETKTTEVDVLESSALATLNRSEIESQVDIAKRWPRSVTASHREAEALACLDEETAASCFYSLPRAGKRIEGPSIRLAEIIASTWGNLRVGARVVEVSREYVVAQGFCYDLEKNVAATVEAKRRITDKHGKRYNADMIQTTSNAACSIALRNAIFRVVPFALVKPIYEKARATSLGKELSVQERRERAFSFYKEHGATDEQILAALERKGIDDVTVDDLLHLRGMVTAIRDGELQIEDALRVPGTEPKSRARVRPSSIVDEATAPVPDQALPDQDTAPDGLDLKPVSDAESVPLGNANPAMAEALSGLRASVDNIDPETGEVLNTGEEQGDVI